jgi:hypothetical protein
MTLISAILLLAFAPAIAGAEEDLTTLIKQLSSQVSALQEQARLANERIRDLENRLQQQEKAAPKTVAAKPPTAPPQESIAPTPTAKPALTAGDAPGTFKLPGTGTSLGFGGYVKLDANYSSVSAGRDRLGDQALVAAQIPIGNVRGGEHSETTFHAKESRLWLKSFSPSAWGDINTFVEVDFFGDPATFTYTPRLRHAFGSIGHFLAGQTWTTFLNTAAIPDTLDINGPVGSLLYHRQPLIRWTQPFQAFGSPMEVQFALESPRTRLWEPANPNGFATPNSDRYPDIVARLNYSPDWGSLSLSALARQIRYTLPLSKDRQEEWGGAISLAGRIHTAGLDNLRFMLGFGDAYGRYATINTFEDAVLNRAGDMHLVSTYSAMVAYEHWWSKAWRSNVAYGYAAADQPDFVTGDMTRQAQSAHANLLWSPTLQTTFGLEYIYAMRERVDGRTGDLHRVQFSSRFNF